FFFTYEGYRESTFQRVNGDVPTPKLRQQILTALPFPETRILMDTLPEPNVVVDENIGRFEGSGRRESTENHFVVKGDIQLTSASRLTLAYTRNRPFGLDPRYNLDGANDRTYDYAQDRVSAQYTLTRGPWIAESRLGYNRSDMQRLDHFFALQDPSKAESIEWQRRVPRLGIQGLATWGSAEVWDMEGGTASFDQKVSRQAGRHLLKAGGRYVRYWGSRTNPENPFYEFANLSDLAANIPATVNITFGSHGPHKSRMFEFGFFAQDDVRVNSKLVLNLGLRYDFYSNDVVKPTGDVPVGVINLSPPSDFHKFDFGPARPLDRPTENDGWINLGPRLGFAYNPDGQGKTVLRGGYGIMYAPQVPALLRQSVGHPIVPFRTINTRAAALRLGISYPMYAEDVRSIEEADVAASGRRLVFSVIDPHLQNPYTMNFQFDVQRAVGRDLMVEMGYVGVLGKKYPMHRRYNLPDRITGERPNPTLIPGGHYVDNSESTTYHSLQASVRKRFANRFSFDAHYTLGRGLS
ncbi:MAG TPA: TonB-dependent receptor, partial [Acidimicrobiales bacterium]